MIYNIQSLRGIAALLIFYHHFLSIGYISNSFGDLGVTFFMMLSGFVIFLSFHDKVTSHCYNVRKEEKSQLNIPRFIKGRFLKIYPLYLLCWIVSVIVLPYRGSRAGCLLGIFMIQSWFPESSIYWAGNAVSWFISDLMFCYLMFIPLCRLWSCNKLLSGFFALVYFIIYFVVVLTTSEAWANYVVYIFPLMQLANFMLGMFLSYCYLKFIGSERNLLLLNKIPRFVILLIEFGLLLLVGISIYFYQYVKIGFALGSYWWLICALIIVVFTIFDKYNKDTILHSSIMLRFGNVSFAFYLIHGIGISLWRRMPFINNSSLVSLFFQSVVLIILLSSLAILINKYFEKSIYQFLRACRLTDCKKS